MNTSLLRLRHFQLEKVRAKTASPLRLLPHHSSAGIPLPIATDNVVRSIGFIVQIGWYTDSGSVGLEKNSSPLQEGLIFYGRCHDHGILLDKVLDQALLDSRKIAKEASNANVDVQSEFGIQVDSNLDLDQAKRHDLGIDISKDGSVDLNDNLGDAIMDQVDGLCSKSIDIDSLGGGDSVVDETVDGIIETGEILRDGDIDGGFDGN